MTGNTESGDFPTTSGAFQTRFRGLEDGFVTKLGPNGRNLTYSTYLGGSTEGTSPYGIALDDGTPVDPTPAAFVTGSTSSADFPLTPGAFQVRNHGPLGQSEGTAFVTKLAPSGDTLAYSTYVGGSASDSGEGIAVSQVLGRVFVDGWTDSTDFPRTGDAYQRKASGRFDAFLARFSLTPVAVTGMERTGRGPLSANVYGTVNAEGNQARYYFQYGRSARYGSRTRNQYVDNDAFHSAGAGVGADHTTHSVSTGVSGLRARTTYHYRLLATNSAGTTRGRDRTFTTA